MSFDDYYGNKHGTTVLQIFSEPIDGSPNIVHRSLRDSEAYDTWHLAYYFKEILDYKRLMQKKSLKIMEIPRPEKNLLLYLLLCADKSFKSIGEIGSTLFEMIDGFEAIVKSIDDGNSTLPKIDIRDLEYIGIDLSEMLRLTSKVIHNEYKITLHETVPQFNEQVDILYDRSVTNYAFANVDELVEFVKHGRIALLNTYFSLGNTFQSARLGKAVTYFSLREFLSKIDNNFYHLFGMRAPNHGRDMSLGNPVVEGFFYYGDSGTLKKFMNLSKTDEAISKYFEEKNIVPREAKVLLQ
jgi:hypothetical protein